MSECCRYQARFKNQLTSAAVEAAPALASSLEPESSPAIRRVCVPNRLLRNTLVRVFSQAWKSGDVN